MRVIAAIGRLMVGSGESYVNALYLQEEPELSDVSQEHIFESVRVLTSRALVDGSGNGRWEKGLTADGLETWLLNFLPNYDQVQRQIARTIVIAGIRDPALLPGETDVPATIVEHVLQRWLGRDLLILNRLYTGLRIDRVSPQIRELAEEDINRADSSA